MDYQWPDSDSESFRHGLREALAGHKIVDGHEDTIHEITDFTIWSIIRQRYCGRIADDRGAPTEIAHIAYDVASIVRDRYESVLNECRIENADLEEQIRVLKGGEPKYPSGPIA